MHVTTMSSLTQPRTATCMRCDTFAICLLMLLHARAAVKPLTPKLCQTAVADVARARGCVSIELPSRLGGATPQPLSAWVACEGEAKTMRAFALRFVPSRASWIVLSACRQ